MKGVPNARSNSLADDRPVRHSLGFEAAVMDMKRLRLWEWQVGLVLEGFERLNATLAEAEKEWER